MVVPDELALSVVEVGQRRSQRVDVAQSALRDVRALQVLRPGDVEGIQPLVHCIESAELRVIHLVASHDDEINVAVNVGIPHRKCSLEIRRAEVLAENRLSALEKLSEDAVQIGEGGWTRHEGEDSGGTRYARFVITYLAIAAATWGVAMALSPMLQIRAILAERSSRGVSAGYQCVLVVGFVLWLAYGIALGNWAIIVPNVIAAAVSVTTISVTTRFRPDAAPR